MTKVEKSYGVILVLRKNGAEDKFLILKQNNNTKSWSFPKGHPEGDETKEETAKRELKEETGINGIEFISTPPIFEEYDFEKNGITYHKINQLFVGFSNTIDVAISSEEIIEYKWVTYNEALKTFVYENPKRALSQVIELLKTL